MAGLELLFSSVQGDLTGKEDALVCCLHWQVIQHGLKCIGTGEMVPFNLAEVSKSEKLPPGWNVSRDLFCLQYMKNNNHSKVFLLKIVRVQNTLLIYFMMRSEKMSEMSVDTDYYVTDNLDSFISAFKNLDELHELFAKNVLREVLQETVIQPEEPEQRPPPSGQPEPGRGPRPDDPLRVPPQHPSRHRQPDWGEPDDPFDIGRGDLNPFGRGGGMIFDPMGTHGSHGRHPDLGAGLPGRLPRGAIPPGARFDPFGPPDLDRSGNPRAGRGGRAGPDPDHLPPPGYDDMFM